MASGSSSDPVVVLSTTARSIFDSRGNPTVEVDITTRLGTYRAAVPSGASTGVYEALELRDGGDAYLGKGVEKAIENIRKVIAPAIEGKDVLQQQEIDDLMVKTLDGSTNEWGYSKAKLGANAILGVSMAVCRAGAAAAGKPLYAYIADLGKKSEFVLPVPACNILNGGSHAGNALAFQEIMVMPTGADSFRQAMQMVAEVYQHLKKIIHSKYGKDAVNVGDEGGFAPPIDNAREALEVVMDAIKTAGYEGKMEIAMDVAASEFFTEEGKYDMAFKSREEREGGGAGGGGGEDGELLSGEELGALYRDLCASFPICSIEDGFDQDDFDSFGKMTAEMGDKVQVVGDDLLVTNVERVKRSIDSKSCNALLLKVNQIGSVTEAINAVLLSQGAGWGVMTSHRSGETEDTFISDLAVGLATGQIKSGAPCRGERTAKYNQLLRIEEELQRAHEEGKGKAPKYAGKDFRKPV